MSEKTNNLEAFENFKAYCLEVIINAEFDAIEWEESMIREVWEKRSFLFNDTMKTGALIWSEKSDLIYDNSLLASAWFKDSILIDKNDSVKKYVGEQLNSLNEEFELFLKKYKLNSAEKHLKNTWFFELFEQVQELRRAYLITIQEDLTSDNYKEDYNGLFVVSETPSMFREKYGIGVRRNIARGVKTFSLQNENIYDQETNEILKATTQSDYNTAFLLKLERLPILEVKPFLSYHFEGSERPNDFIDYLKYGMLHSINLKNEGVKAIIKDWLQEIEEALKPSKKEDDKSFKDNVLFLREVALLHFYKGTQITKENSDSIAREFGHKSGHKLYQHYNKYHSTTDRTGDEGTKKRNENKIRNIENILSLLTIDERKRAEEELRILKSITKSNYD